MWNYKQLLIKQLWNSDQLQLWNSDLFVKKMLIYSIIVDHIDNNSTKERWRREIEKHYIRTPEQLVVYGRNEQM